MTDYLEQMRNMRLKLSKEMLENDREKEIIVKPYDNKIYDMYGKAFDSDFICKNGTKFEKDNVIKDGLSAFTIAMATMHSLYGNDVSKDALPCQIYLGDSISVVLNTAHTTGIVLRNSDGKIISY